MLLKIFDLVRRSSFDGRHHYTIAVDGTDSSKEEIILLAFSPDSSSATVVKAPRGISLKDMGKSLGIPIDAYLITRKDYVSLGDDYKDISSFTNNAAIHYNDEKTTATILDLARLWLFSKGVSPASIKVIDLSDQADDPQLDKTVAPIFSDTTIVNEKLSIQIINATDTSGVGSRLARYITNAGGNVVSVTSLQDASEKETSSIEYSGESSYTVKKLEKLLGIKAAHVQNTGLSDIIIQIGKDRATSTIF